MRQTQHQQLSQQEPMTTQPVWSSQHQQHQRQPQLQQQQRQPQQEPPQRPPLAPRRDPPQPPPQQPQPKRPRIPGPAAAFLGPAPSDPPLLALAAAPAEDSAHLTQRAAATVSGAAGCRADFASPCWLRALEAAGMGGGFAPAGPPLQPSLHDIASGARRGVFSFLS